MCAHVVNSFSPDIWLLCFWIYPEVIYRFYSIAWTTIVACLGYILHLCVKFHCMVGLSRYWTLFLLRIWMTQIGFVIFAVRSHMLVVYWMKCPLVYGRFVWHILSSYFWIRSGHRWPIKGLVYTASIRSIEQYASKARLLRTESMWGLPILEHRYLRNNGRVCSHNLINIDEVRRRELGRGTHSIKQALHLN